MTNTLVIGIDGSEPSQRAAEWAAQYANAVHAHVIAVHAVEIPILGPFMYPSPASPGLTPEQGAHLRDVCQRDYCKPLADAGVDYEVVIQEGFAAPTLIDIAKKRDADLVVVGRRGRGGFAELVLGSTSHELALHLGRPLVIVP